MYVALRDLDAGVRDPPVETDPSFFVGFISRLVRATKGIEIELTEADALADSPELRREYRRKVQRLRRYYEKKRSSLQGEGGRRGKRNPRMGRQLMLTARHILLTALVLLALFGVLLSGHDGVATPTAPKGQRCTSPYDGVWSGTLIGVNEREDFRPTFMEGVAFDLTLRLSCLSTEGGATPLEVTEVRASHWPLGCTDGCKPVKATALFGPPGQDGSLYFEFPNGVSIVMRFEVSSDGKRIQGLSGEPLAWSFGHASRCPELEGQCRPMTGSFTLTKRD